MKMMKMMDVEEECEDGLERDENGWGG